ncbi:MAG: aldo/keto reductase [Planctomycetota bacterium]
MTVANDDLNTNDLPGIGTWIHGRVVLGLWPIAGVTTIGVTRKDVDSTMDAALDCGIRSFDTAYSYGLIGESDDALRRAMRRNAGRIDRNSFCVISKVAQRYDASGRRYVDARPSTLVADAEESLSRLGIDRFDCLMLHSIDEDVPIEASADALHSLRRRGLADRIGICNATTQQRQQFASVGPCEAMQCPLNLLQQDTLAELISPAASDGVAVLTYWALMKGLLAGRIGRDHQFAHGDSRPGYAIFQGRARERAHRLVDGLTDIAGQVGCSVAELSISWVLNQPGVSAVLAGARRPSQVQEFAAAQPLSVQLSEQIQNVMNHLPLPTDEGDGARRG